MIHAGESHCGLNRNADLKAGVARNGFDSDAAARVLDDAIDDVKPQARAFADPFCGEKGIEDAGFDFWGNAGTVVGDFDQDEIVFVSGANGERTRAFHGIGGTDFGEGRHELPRIGDVARFEPRLDGVLAIGSGQLILKLSRLQRGADFLFTLGEKSTVLWANGGAAGRAAKAGETVAKSGRGTASGGGRVVELMREACGQFAERGEFLVLLFLTGDVANAVGKQADEAADEFGEAMEHLIEIRDVEDQVMRRNDRPPRDTNNLKARKRKHAADFAAAHGEYGAVGRPMFCSGANLAFQHDEHELRLVAFAHNDVARGKAELLALGNKPEQVVLREIREDSDLAQLLNELFGRSGQ